MFLQLEAVSEDTRALVTCGYFRGPVTIYRASRY